MMNNRYALGCEKNLSENGLQYQLFDIRVYAFYMLKNYVPEC